MSLPDVKKEKKLREKSEVAIFDALADLERGGGKA
jgi:hypothetical protein